MNKNKTILKRIPLLLMALFLFNSCFVEQELDAPHATGSEITFTAKLPAMALAATRATDGTLAENRVRQLDLLVFAKNGNLKEIKQVTPIYDEDADAIHKYVKFRTRLTAGNYDFMLVANARSLVSEVGIVSQADVAAALIFTFEPEDILTLSDTDEGVIPMWAQLKDVTMANGAINKTEFSTGLTRIHAKINVSAADVATTTFKLESVAFYNYNTKGRIVPASTNYPLVASDNPSLPTSPTPGVGAVNNTAKGADVSPYTFDPTATNKCEDKIYVLEAASIPYNTTGWQTSPCLIIGGRYGGESNPITYYRIDFIGTNKAGTLKQPLNILRNHIYQVAITAVTGKGYDTAADALNNAPSNTISEVKPWDNDPYADVSVDGPDYLGVTPSTINYTAAGGELDIKLKSSLNWTAEYYDMDGNVISSSWFTITEGKTGNAGDDIPLTVNAIANTNVEREGYILFSAGRMTVRVDVVQERKLLEIELYEWEAENYEYPLPDETEGYSTPYLPISKYYYTPIYGFPTDRKNDLHFNVGHPQTIKYRITIPQYIESWTIEATGAAENQLTFTPSSSGTAGGIVWITANAGNVDWSNGGIVLKSDGVIIKELKTHQCGVISKLKNAVSGPNGSKFYYGLMYVNERPWLDRNLGATTTGIYNNIVYYGVDLENHDADAKGHYIYYNDAEASCPAGFRLATGHTDLDDPTTYNLEEWGYVYANAQFIDDDGKWILDQNGRNVYYKRGWYVPLTGHDPTRNWIIQICGNNNFKHESQVWYWHNRGYLMLTAHGYDLSWYRDVGEFASPVRCIRDDNY